jgi:hypothetical protein
MCCLQFSLNGICSLRLCEQAWNKFGGKAELFAAAEDIYAAYQSESIL